MSFFFIKKGHTKRGKILSDYFLCCSAPPSSKHQKKIKVKIGAFQTEKRKVFLLFFCLCFLLLQKKEKMSRMKTKKTHFSKKPLHVVNTIMAVGIFVNLLTCFFTQTGPFSPFFLAAKGRIPKQTKKLQRGLKTSKFSFFGSTIFSLLFF